MLTTLIALAAASQAATTAPATARATTPAADELATWVAQVDRQIDAHLVQPAFGGTGTATVTFRRGADGRPTEITVRSGSPLVSQAAVRTMELAGPLPALPSSMPANQRVTFRFLVGIPGHEDEFEAARTRMVGAARRTNVALAAQLAGRTQVAALPGQRVELAALDRR